MPEFIHSSTLPVPADAAFSWHGRNGALERLLPPGKPVRLITRTGTIRNGDCTVLELGTPPFALRWTAVHQDYQEGISFCDVQEHGPFAHWKHTHRIHSSSTGCVLEDHIDWKLPAWAEWLSPFVHQELTTQFTWRHRRTAQDLARHFAYAQQPPMTIGISGSSGLVGSTLGSFLSAGGHNVRRLVRGEALDDTQIPWNPQARGPNSQLDPRMNTCDAVVHLAGAGIADGLWTDDRKIEIHHSRVDGTRALCEGLARCDRRPRVLICASGSSFYGQSGDSVDESSPPGSGFLADICREWEAACEPAVQAGIRVVHVRMGMVLSAQGGALQRMLPAFRCGVGGYLGDGQQMVSWIGLDDAIGAIHHLLMRDDLHGAFNLTAPESVTNADFTQALASALDRPAWFPVPKFAVLSLFGEMGETLLLQGRSVVPQRLIASGFHYLTPTLAESLPWELGITMPSLPQHVPAIAVAPRPIPTSTSP